MNKRSPAGGDDDVKGRKGSGASKSAPAAEVGMKPRRGLFIGLFAVIVVWAGFLLYMYFATVRPLEHKQPVAPQPTSARQSASIAP
jgi:hypothetical protein